MIAEIPPPDPVVVAVCDDAGIVTRPELLAGSETLHRQLRPQLPADYRGAMAAVFANGGRMLVAQVDDMVVGLAVYRVMENTISGRFLYVDDLVTDQHRRSRGIGAVLLTRCEDLARQHACREVILDSGLHRADTHRFYFRQGYGIRAFNFAKALSLPR